MPSNTVNLNFFLAKNGVSWENIGLTKPNTECIAGQASTPVSPRPSSPGRKRSSKSPTSRSRQEAARSPIRKWSRDQQGSLQRRQYPKAPRSPFASTFHIQNSPHMSEEERRRCTTNVTRCRKYLKQRVFNQAKNAAEKAQEVADKAWLAFEEAERAALVAKEAFEKLKAGEPQQPGTQADNTIPGLNEGNKTPEWRLSDDGEVEYHDKASSGTGAEEDQAPPCESIRLEEFPEHETMLDLGADRIAAGFGDLVPGGSATSSSQAEMEESLSEAEDELESHKKLLPPLQRKGRATGRALSHGRTCETKGGRVNMMALEAKARLAERAVKAGSRHVQSAVRKVRAERWSLNQPGELARKRSKLSQVHGAASEKDA